MIRVSSTSIVTKVAGSIAHELRNSPRVHVQAIGAGAVNQAVKAIATAREYVLADGFDLYDLPTFQDVEVDGEIRTAIKFIVMRES